MLGSTVDTADNSKMGASEVLCEGLRGCREERPCQMTCSEVIAATTTDNSTIVTTPTNYPTPVPADTSDTTAGGNDESNSDNIPDADTANNDTTNAETSTIGSSEKGAAEEENSDATGNRTLMV